MTDQARDDAESYQDGGSVLGGPIDPPPETRTLYQNVVASEQLPRQPIVPAEWRNRNQRREITRYAVGAVGYHAAFHALRTPKYLVKVLVWSPVGVFTTSARLLWWARAEEGNWSLRQHAATRNDADTWLKLDARRQHQAGWRWWVLGAGTAAALVALFLLLTVAPWWLRWPGAAGLAVALAWTGRPADKPITDRVVIGERFTRLTAEMVRSALCSLGIAGIKEPAQLTFPQPGIHRDGPGWLARVNLPEGVEAVQVLERRGRLSSALRLPIDQVWPGPGPEHAGQIDLWVGYLPSSKMGQPRWSLAHPHARTSVFAENEFGTDERQRPVKTSLFAQNFLIGGRPGSGKSYAARTIVTIAALDPTAELKIVEYKGTGDFLDFAPLCSTYACGLSDQDFQTGLDMLVWGLTEAERRGARIKAAYERGEAPERKVTPELARRPGSGLHPLVLVIDEAHELFGDAEVGKAAAAAAERLAKRGRALNIILVICTQIPDKDSLPTGITRNIGIRWCLAVPDQVANDMILGTGAYKRGVTATVYRPKIDAGWGVLIGLAEAGAVRSHFPDAATTRAILARAAALRGGVVGQDLDTAPTRDVLDDVLRVFAHLGRPAVSWQQLAEILAGEHPDVYGRHTPESLSALVRAAGVPSVNVKVGGDVLKGCRRPEVQAAVERREVSDGR